MNKIISTVSSVMKKIEQGNVRQTINEKMGIDQLMEGR